MGKSSSSSSLSGLKSPKRVDESRIVSEHRYRDASDVTLYWIMRVACAGNRVRPLVCTVDENGIWPRRGEVQTPVPYRLPELLTLRPGDTIHVVEGEGDADRLADLGLNVTTNAFGARAWRSEWNELLRGLWVVVHMDKDQDGRERATRFVRELDGIATTVMVLAAAVGGNDSGCDVSDHLDAGLTLEQLVVVDPTSLPSAQHKRSSRPVRPAVRTQPMVESSAKSARGRAKAYAAAAMEAELATVRAAPHGTRNRTLYDAARHLMQHVEANLLHVGTVETQLTLAVRAAEGPRMASSDIRATLGSARRWAKKNPRVYPDFNEQIITRPPRDEDACEAATWAAARVLMASNPRGVGMSVLLFLLAEVIEGGDREVTAGSRRMADECGCSRNPADRFVKKILVPAGVVQKGDRDRRDHAVPLIVYPEALLGMTDAELVALMRSEPRSNYRVSGHPFSALLHGGSLRIILRHNVFRQGGGLGFSGRLVALLLLTARKANVEELTVMASLSTATVERKLEALTTVGVVVKAEGEKYRIDEDNLEARLDQLGDNLGTPDRVAAQRSRHEDERRDYAGFLRWVEAQEADAARIRVETPRCFVLVSYRWADYKQQSSLPCSSETCEPDHDEGPAITTSGAVAA